MRSRRSAPVPALLAAVALTLPLAACTGGDGGTPTETVTVTVGPDDGGEPRPSAPPSAEPPPPVTQTPEAEPLDDTGPEDDAPFVANTEPDTSTGSGLVEATDLRFGRHEGYDRLVLDLGGSGAPSWRAEYVGEARGQGSGELVALDGDAVLRMDVQGVRYPGEDGAAEYEGPDVIAPPPGGAIREVVVDSVFEGTMEIFVGVAAETPFRVYLLADPTRLVLDVRNP